MCISKWTKKSLSCGKEGGRRGRSEKRNAKGGREEVGAAWGRMEERQEEDSIMGPWYYYCLRHKTAAQQLKA
jgi:hypothetical protein